jgi:outer membrane translocation and assembly module TamA
MQSGDLMSARRAVSLGLILFLAITTNALPAALVTLDTGGVTDQEVAEALKDYMNLPLIVEMADLPSMAAEPSIDQRVDAECQRLTTLIHSFGYLEASVECRIEPPQHGIAGPAAANGQDGALHGGAVHIVPLQGQLYRIGIIEVTGVAGKIGNAEIESNLGESLTRYAGLSARADRLSEMESRILRQIRKLRPLARIRDREIALDRGRRLAIVSFAIDVGQAAPFGDVSYRGLRRFPIKSVAKLSPFQPGDPFDGTLLAEFERRLSATGRFHSVRVAAASKTDKQGRLPVNVTVREEPPDTGALFSSGQNLLLASCGTLIMIALRLLASAIRAGGRLQRGADAFIVILLCTTVAIAVSRILSLI